MMEALLTMADAEMRTTCYPGVCEGRAFIMGPNQFQNALVAAYIETHSNWKSGVIDSIAAICLNCGRDDFCRTVVLCDCFGLSAQEKAAEFIEQLSGAPDGCHIAIFNLDRRAGIEGMAFQFGVQGVFYQDEPVETLIKGLAAMFGGEFWFSRRKMAEIILQNGFGHRLRQFSGQDYPNGLTRREVEILGLLTLGATNDVIASKLFISPHTVRTHLNNVFRKINVTNRLSASLWAVETLFPHKPDHEGER